MNDVNGLTYRKADLHVHTPESLCYRDLSVRPEQIVGAALETGLDILGVTDHNTVEAIDDIRAAARGQGLFIFPGIELSTPGGHVIVLFEENIPSDDLRNFLSAVGLPRESWGDASVMTQSSLEEVLEKTHQYGGINVAAHIERWPSGFLETGLPRREKLRIHENQYLNALEITIPQNKDLWNNGLMRDFPRRHACIQASDAHAPEEIGRRFVQIEMERPSLECLRAAFVDHQTKIVFP
ncbi:MAG: PHP domain-containing protein [Deltaproteobacteria bacterium]|nr:PHP domain-containing protein [Deltaproteobacteria bacterium]